MRRANEATALKGADGTIYAINLGADFCAEHEWGIGRIRRDMGLTDEEPRTGLSYHAAKVPGSKNLISRVSKGNHFIVFDGVVNYYRTDEEKKSFSDNIVKGDRELGFPTWRRDNRPQVLATAWDEGSFGIVIGKDADPDLKEFGVKLVSAIETGDFAVWFGGGGGPFSRSGLVVAITSLVPQDVKDYMVDSYKELTRLEAADAATGVKELLAVKGKKYYACSPRFQQDKVSIQYWLNPMEQQIHNYGWFTPQELIDWANGVVGNKVDMAKK